MNNMNPFETLLALTQDAITASGKKFKEIDPDAIKGFLRDKGLNKTQIAEAMDRLSEIYTGTKKTKKTEIVGTPVETNSSYTPKVREARKNVFGDIKRIA
jgi:hypothetical protein